MLHTFKVLSAAADEAGSTAGGSEPTPASDEPLPDGYNEVVAQRMALAWSPDDPPDAVGLDDTGDEGAR